MLDAMVSRCNWALERHVVGAQFLAQVNSARIDTEEAKTDVNISVCAVLVSSYVRRLWS